MSSVLSNAAKGLPILVGVLLGIFLYTRGLPISAWLPLVALGVAFFSLRLGRKVIRKCPFLGWLIIELWVIAAVSVMAVTTTVILWLTVTASTWFPLEEKERQAVSGALVGAATAYAAVLWTRDIQNARGYFWTGTQFHKALKDAFDNNEPHAPKDNTRAYEVVILDHVPPVPDEVQGLFARGCNKVIDGWGFNARRCRACILEEDRKSRRPPAT